MSVNDSKSYDFDEPVTLTFKFDLNLVLDGVTPSVYYFDSSSGQWIDIGGTVSGNNEEEAKLIRNPYIKEALDMSKKRTFKSFGQFRRELFFLVKNRKNIRRALRSGKISPDFRERLMLAVTSVNDCRYCSYYHTRLALQEGVSAREAARLLEGSVDHCPPQEAAALLYAQHWAESDGNPNSETVQRIIGDYGEQTLRDIDMLLHMIRMGNYLGNAVDIVREKLTLSKKTN